MSLIQKLTPLVCIVAVGYWGLAGSVLATALYAGALYLLSWYGTADSLRSVPDADSTEATLVARDSAQRLGLAEPEIKVIRARHFAMAYAVKGHPVVAVSSDLLSAPPAVLRSAVNHELAHLRLGHVLRHAFADGLVVVMVYLAAGALIPQGAPALIETLSWNPVWELFAASMIGLGLVSLLVPVLSRQFELDADELAARLDNDTNVREMLEYIDDCKQPARWYRRIWATHPSIAVRIAARKA